MVLYRNDPTRPHLNLHEIFEVDVIPPVRGTGWAVIVLTVRQGLLALEYLLQV